MRKAARVDDNQKEIVKQLRQIPNLSIAITSQLGKGFPDFIIGYKSLNYMIELKDGSKVESKRKLTPDEVIFHESWKGQINVCNNIEEIFKLIGI